MYDMYPEWGPSRHEEEDHGNPLQEALDRRDNRGERPDDN